MAFSGGFDEMSGSELLDEVDALAVRQREIDTELLVAAQSWAVRHSGERLRRTERAHLYGGTGTPQVAAFAGAAFGARMGRSSYAGDMFIADASIWPTGCPSCGGGCGPARCSPPTRASWRARPVTWRRTSIVLDMYEYRGTAA